MSITQSKIQTFSFCDSYIDRLVEYIQQEYIGQGRDLSRLAIVFGGKRPAMFIKRKLAQKLKSSYFPPRFFNIDEFMKYIVKKNQPLNAPQDLDACFEIYCITQKVSPKLVKGRASFAEFLPWAREIRSFIDQLDLENIDEKKLLSLKSNAQIGYDVPDDINQLLASIVSIRQAYHAHLKRDNLTSRGYNYFQAAQLIASTQLNEFDEVLFCNFFYFNKSEETVVKNLIERKAATLIFQGDERKWPVMERIARIFETPLREGETIDRPAFDLKLYCAFDAHAQVAHAREILKKIKAKDKTVIVLPDTNNLIPLLAEISPEEKDFNVSCGYPLRRSSLYNLLEFLFQAQNSRKDGRYYARDYLKCLRHPFIKNMRLGKEPAVTRVMVHKIEEILTGKETTAVSGSLFLDLEDMESLDELYMMTIEMAERMGHATSRQELEQVIETIHALFFRQWEALDHFKALALALKNTLDHLLSRSFLKNYPLNLNIAEKLYELVDEFASATFNEERFELEDIFHIFENAISNAKVSFTGSPLKGLQILGLQETRSLNFENVIVLDVNEGVLPNTNLYKPLIPREVMISLNIGGLELEEEIQRYQFMRLISSAKNVHLIYQQSKERERSRFIEELIWEEQKEKRALETAVPLKARFAAGLELDERRIKKTPEMIRFLKGMVFSASGINTYLRNPYEFYTQYVLGLRESEDLLDEPDARHVGTFVHEVLEELYNPYIDKKPAAGKKLRERFERIFEHRFEERFARSMKTDAFLLRSVLLERFDRFLENEEKNFERRVERVLALEHHCADMIKFSCGEVRFRYIVDRIDQMADGTIMVTDYKTGAVDVMPKKLDKLAGMELTRESMYENIKSFQVPLYFHYISQQYKGRRVNAGLYSLRTLEFKRFVDNPDNEAIEKINEFFGKALDVVVSEILDPKIDFIEEKGIA